MVSHPGHFLIVLGWCPILVSFLIVLGWCPILVSFLIVLGWCPILVHGTRIARGLGTIIIHVSLHLCLVSSLVPQEILVMAPELQEDLLGTKVKKVLLSLIQNKELGATRDVTAPELQEVSLYQFI